jgi:hypothetical protein
MSQKQQNGKKRRDILPTNIISIVGAIAIAAVPATVADFDFTNGHLYRGSSFAGMAFLIAALPLGAFLFQYLRGCLKTVQLA